MPTSFMRKGGAKIKKGVRSDALFIFVFSLLFCLLCYGLAHLLGRDKQPAEPSPVMTAKEAANTNVLQNKLHINRPNAEIVSEVILEAQRGARRPQSLYNAPYTPGHSVAYDVQEKLAQNDPTLPPEALEKTDKTIVAEQPENKEVPVGIYKINTYRNWEIGVGAGVHDGKAYIPVSLQRNYKKDRSVVLELHYDLKDNKVNGGEVQWKVHF